MHSSAPIAVHYSLNVSSSAPIAVDYSFNICSISLRGGACFIEWADCVTFTPQPGSSALRTRWASPVYCARLISFVLSFFLSAV